MSCLKNLIILTVVVGFLIYITEESKKEKFSIIKNLISGKKPLSRKQINIVDKKLKNDQSRDELISELNSEVVSVQESEVQPAQKETNYEILGKNIKNGVLEITDFNQKATINSEEEVQSEQSIFNVIGKKYSRTVDEELDRRVSYNSDKNRMEQQIEEEESFKKFLSGRAFHNQEESVNQESEYKITPYVQEESMLIFGQDSKNVSKYQLIDEEKERIAIQNQHLAQEHERVKSYEEESGINRDAVQVVDEEAIYDKRTKDDVSLSRRQNILAEEEQIAKNRQRYILQEREEESVAPVPRGYVDPVAEIQEPVEEESVFMGQSESVTEEEQGSSSSDSEISRNKEQEIIEEEKLLKQKYLERKNRKSIKKAHKKKRVKHHKKEDTPTRIQKKALHDIKSQHKKEIKCGTYIEPNFGTRVDGYPGIENTYQSYEESDDSDKPTSLRDAYNKMIPKVNRKKNPHCYLNTHGKDNENTLGTCSNTYSMIDGQSNNSQVDGVFSNDTCFDSYSKY